ncbi:hypothetical protein [Cerasicoccus arenae]|uniref:Uncharacterized protein n=1 Tax=Cerasicoccus arenae TaxID=424488 RepID=A0A8J3DAK3_9BACT|nr:hypothetical protein [Cerasicoccus arenae]MBK1857527.1 hypothetical protein [Cerasicoccus arenae]GHB95525.1 hypothetical protein GCM10007047_09160 [Cerasicoccus arenae]
MSYVRRRNSVHFHINGYRIRKGVFWRWIGASSLIVLLTIVAMAWTFYSKDHVIHQAASQLLEQFSGR